MTSAGGYRVETGELDAHSTQVSGIAADLAQAAAAGQATSPLGSDAFGIIGQAFAALVQGTVTSATANLEATSKTARQLADGVGKAGEAYGAMDEGAAGEMNRIGEEL